MGELNGCGRGNRGGMQVTRGGEAVREGIGRGRESELREKKIHTKKGVRVKYRNKSMHDNTLYIN